MVASHAQGSHAEHHSVMWRAGDTHRYISHSVAGYPATIVTNGSHSFSPGDTIRISQHLGSVPDINGDYRILDVPSSTTLRIDISLNTGGTAGRVNSYSDVVMGIDGVIVSPDSPALVSPMNGAENLHADISFQWSKVEYTGNYLFQLSTSDEFTSLVVEEVIYDTLFTISNLQNNREFYWRVRAENIDGESDWSEVWNFTTIPEMPSIPLLASPADGSEDIPINTVLSWEATDHAERYRVQLSTDSDFDEIVIDSGTVTNTSLSVHNLTYDTEYYWRVRAKNDGGVSAWSSVWGFRTVYDIPDVVTLLSPANEVASISNDTLLVWLVSERAEFYHVQVSVELDFNSVIVDSLDVTKNWIEVEGLAEETEYYWRVRGRNINGFGGWSEVWSFTTDESASPDTISDAIPTNYALEQNYPNPFNPSTTIRFSLPSDAFVYLEVYSMLGQHVVTLIPGEYFTAGSYEALWDARDYTGHRVSSGMYIYRLSAGGYINVKKMIYLK
jgi:hypothetical protein